MVVVVEDCVFFIFISIIKIFKIFVNELLNRCGVFFNIFKEYNIEGESIFWELFLLKFIIMVCSFLRSFLVF